MGEHLFIDYLNYLGAHEIIIVLLVYTGMVVSIDKKEMGRGEGK